MLVSNKIGYYACMIAGAGIVLLLPTLLMFYWNGCFKTADLCLRFFRTKSRLYLTKSSEFAKLKRDKIKVRKLTKSIRSIRSIKRNDLQKFSSENYKVFKEEPGISLRTLRTLQTLRTIWRFI